jgi:hypothetical protein
MSKKHPIFDRFYEWLSPRMDQGGVLAHRRQLLVGLSGRVIEVGAGNGLKLRSLPAGSFDGPCGGTVISPPQPRSSQCRAGSGRGGSHRWNR